MECQVNDLRSALELLRTMPGQLIETDTPVEPMAELAGVYRYVGAGGTDPRDSRGSRAGREGAGRSRLALKNRADA